MLQLPIQGAGGAAAATGATGASANGRLQLNFSKALTFPNYAAEKKRAKLEGIK